MGITGNAVGVAKEAPGTQIFVAKPEKPLNQVSPAGEKNIRQFQTEKKRRQIHQINTVYNKARQGVKYAEPVVKEAVGNIAEQGSPKNRGPQICMADNDKNGNKREPAKEG